MNRAIADGSGSSPHTRGAHRILVPWICEIRIIPAYAGSTPDLVRYPQGAPDHPRIRGEHSPALMPIAGRSGSSPHTRGALKGSVGKATLEGIIPAYAGSTWPRDTKPYLVPDHPRIRGEHGAEADGAGREAWIIPAYAGSTRARRPRRRDRADHPRIRGEHVFLSSSGSFSPGSSPHTRGARLLYYDTDSVIRIIPAYAGSTFPSLASTSARRDHPRIRGEHHLRVVLVGPVAGSSPHTRGAQRPVRVARPGLRIIPAYAGSTPRPPTPPPSRTDHPRIRGEHAAPE